MSTAFCFVVDSSSPEETQWWASRLAALLKKGDVVLLNANLGSGKTTFVQGFMRKRGIKETAVSPTFVAAQTYGVRVPLHHLDFYRLTKKEILDMGLQDYLLGQGEIAPGIALVEWADRCRPLWPKEFLEIQIKIKKKSEVREIKFCGVGQRYRDIVKKLKA